MAAYAVTTVLDFPRAKRVSKGLFMISGYIDITNYNTTPVEITDITSKFRTVLSVICTSMSGNGYLAKWLVDDKSFLCAYPRAAQAAVTTDMITITASGAANITDGQSCTVNAALRSAVDASAATEAATDTDIGIVNFVAYGMR